MRAFMSFSDASGLCMNKDKSDIFMNGVPNPVAEEILLLSGFQKGKFPFRYLGIPISYKRLSNLECNKLVEKMVERIRSWGAKHLSYAGRLVLVRTVLSQLHSYWARIFLLPKGIIHKVECICRAYLWSGSEEHHKVPAVSWDTCCLPKIYGGLGIDNCHMRNIAMLGNFSARCAGKIRQWLGVDWHGDIITWGLKWHYKSLLKKKIILAVLSSLIYLIWETRKKCRVEQLVQHPDCLVHRVQERVKARMNVLKVESFRSRDIAWVNSVLAY
ncbi:uncharacterized protein LOC141601399 [Silene latifolia]|uniref:uncharacterized protein LOC141601399 n=1 Tax=Silene latifolia TaxID=37657 RepID=UPI003D77EBB2